MGAAEEHVGLDFQFVQVDVRLVEAVEQDQAVCAGLVQSLRHVGEITEKGTELHGHRDTNGNFYFPENVDIGLLYLGAGDAHPCGNEVNIAFDGVGSGLFNLLGILRPTAEGRTVEASDNGNVHGVFGFANVIQIVVGPGSEFDGRGKVTGRLDKTMRADTAMVFNFGALLRQLFFKQGVEHDG